MPNSLPLPTALWLMCLLITLATLQQTLELLFVNPYAWHLIEPETPRLLRPILSRYRGILICRLVATLLAAAYLSLVALKVIYLFRYVPVLHSPLANIFSLDWLVTTAVSVLVVTTWLIAVRWRGTFNGGSDQMTLYILIAWWIARVFPERGEFAVLMVATLSLMSYFVAGLSKLMSSGWRSGSAPSRFMDWRLLNARPFGLALAWSVIAFETLSPLALLDSHAFGVWLAAGVLFHLANAYALGLNRFVLVWIATYPALYWASQSFSSR